MRYSFFKSAMRLTFRGKWVVRLLTILLSALSFMFFSFAATSFTGNIDSYRFRAYRNYLQSHSLLYFSNNNRTIDNAIINQSDVLTIESGLDIDLISFCVNEVPINNFVDKFYFRGDKFAFDGNTGEIVGYTSEYEEYQKETEGKNVSSSGGVFDGVLIGTEDAYSNNNFVLLAGRYPQEENEIVISEAHYQMFKWGGYIDVHEAGCYDGVERIDPLTGEVTVDYGFNNEIIPPSQNKIEINSYDDLIGRKLVSFEKQVTGGSISHINNPPQEIVIVGVVDAEAAPSWDYKRGRGYFNNPILRSESWRQKMMAEDRLFTEAMLTRTPIDNQSIMDVISVSQKLYINTLQRYENTASEDPNMTVSLIENGAQDISSLFEPMSETNLDLLIMIVCGIGIVFFIFAVLLNAHLITAMMNTKSRQFGILRALGVSKQKILALFLLGTIALAGIIFFVSLALALIVYYTFWMPWTIISDFGVSPFVLNGWTILILLEISFAVPLLSVLFPIKRFTQISIVDTIRGNDIKRVKRK